MVRTEMPFLPEFIQYVLIAVLGVGIPLVGRKSPAESSTNNTSGCFIRRSDGVGRWAGRFGGSE
jgi:hypothetical protein